MNNNPIPTTFAGLCVVMLVIISVISVSKFAESIFYSEPTKYASESGNVQLILQEQKRLEVTRPIHINVVKFLNRGIYAEANTSFNGSGACVVNIREDKLQYLYHELQHCMGAQH